MVTGQQFKEILRRWVDALNAKDWAAFDKLVDETVTGEYVGHLPGAQDPVRGPQGMKQYFRGVIQALPDYRGAVEDVMVAGDSAAARFTARHTDPATGKAQRAMAIMISHLKSGKFSEDWELVGPWEDEA